MNKRRVLIISTVGLIYDGITSVITSYLETIDLSNLEIYVAGTIKVESSIREKIEKLNCKIIDLPNRKTETVKYFFTLQAFIRKNKIEVVHAHGNSATLAIDLLAARLGGCKKRIAHSHNTKCDQVKADKILRPLFNHLYTDALACGEAAGKWLYGDKPFKILKNGRDIEKYKFDPKVRESMRTQYGIKDELVVGHVGGFVGQKNHVFLIKLFREILKTKPDSKLVLVGDGVLRKKIEESVTDIQGSVLFIRNTDHVEDYLQMMDVMVLPSLFEGLPLVVIEWQINGLPCLISDNVTKECKISNLIYYLPLNDDAAEWASMLIKLIKQGNTRSESQIIINEIRSMGFDIRDNVKLLKNMYEFDYKKED